MVFVVPAILAGLLGLLANAADDPAAYVPRLRLMFLGSVGLGYLGLTLFVWLMARGWRRWGALLLALVAIRVAYVPTIATAVVVTGWMDWFGRLLGVTKLEGPIHYTLACNCLDDFFRNLFRRNQFPTIDGFVFIFIDPPT